MDNVFDNMDEDKFSMSMATAEVGMEAVDSVVNYYASLLEQAIFIL